MSLNSIGNGSLGSGELQYFRLQFPMNGLTIFLSVSTGSVICYASDEVQNPNGRQSYIWRVQSDGYSDLFIDPLLLGRAPGTYMYIGIEGINNTNTFIVNNTAGDKRGTI